MDKSLLKEEEKEDVTYVLTITPISFIQQIISRIYYICCIVLEAQRQMR